MSRLDSKYITNYSSSYFAILAHTPAANIEYKNTELKDVYFELNYSSNANSEYYSATVIATGYVGPYTVGTAPKADSAVNHYLRIEEVSSSDRIYETDTGSGAYSYKEWSISNNASKTYYMKKPRAISNIGSTAPLWQDWIPLKRITTKTKQKPISLLRIRWIPFSTTLI